MLTNFLSVLKQQNSISFNLSEYLQKRENLLSKRLGKLMSCLINFHLQCWDESNNHHRSTIIHDAIKLLLIEVSS